MCGDAVTWTYPCDNQKSTPYDGCDDNCQVMPNFGCDKFDIYNGCSYFGPVSITLISIIVDSDPGTYKMVLDVTPYLYAYSISSSN